MNVFHVCCLLVCFVLGEAIFSGSIWASGDTGHYHIGQRELPKVIIQAEPSQFEVYPNHPRLFFRDTDLLAIRERIQDSHKEEWQEMVSYIDNRLLKRDATDFAKGAYLKSWSYGRNVAFVAAITGEKKYRDWALSWADFMARTGPEGNDDQYRGRLMSMAVAYDWLYQWLSDEEKKLLQDAIVEHIEKNWYFAERPSFTGGHSRWGNFSLAAGLLSVVTELPELREKLLSVRENWLNGYHPVQEWIAVDGGYHMGWTYSHPYLAARNHCAWSSATNECTYYPWREGLPYFWIYGDRGDGTYPNTGDAYSARDSLNYNRGLLLVSAGVFKNRHAAWLVKPTWNRFYDVLYGDKNVEPLAPGDPGKPLSLSRHFRNAGVVIARDRWDEKTTQLQFKSTSFYSTNHHHRAENSFTINYRGPLAIDSGRYDSYGSIHWRNYFTRTIAHNAILVYDPEQEMELYGKPTVNDGGQPFRREPVRVEDIVPGGYASLDGIIRFEDRPEFTYACGDATKAYDPERVKLAQRDVVYLRAAARAHPIIIVFDRVQSAKPEFEKRFLLHTVNEPVVDGKLCVTENKGGRLSCVTLLPENAELRLIGGPGKEFWVNDQNYPPDRLSDQWKDVAGSWRLEVVQGEKNTLDYFLHVMLVDDADAPPVDPDSAALIKGKNCAGVQIADWTVVFPFSPKGADSVEYTVDQTDPRNHMVVALTPHNKVKYDVNGQAKGQAATGAGGCAIFQIDAEEGARITVNSIERRDSQ